ncbi:C6 finger domain-containing protein [Stagonosporopsis vannaccii]|nr:C6 finger domain-containing protein [Stagonosporopsis vannaccii]
MPKRSAGCFECRKRKVRCDETKPECNTCLRRGTKCPGYRPAQSFILHQFDTETERPQLIKEDEERYRYAYQTPPASDQSSTNSSRNNSFGTLVVRQEQTRAEPQVPKQVSVIAVDRIQHLGTFIRLYLPRADGPALPPPSALMLALPTMPANSQVLLAAIDALSAAQLAVNDRDRALVNRSRSMYGTALSQMLKAIQDPVLALKDETLLSTYMLTLYEVFVGVTQGHGFFYHVQGLLHLVRQRGPSSFTTRLSLQIFHAIRYNSLSIGYHMRKASLLDSPEWLAVTARAAKTDPYVALNDICICIPRLLERTDKIGAPDCAGTELDSIIEDSQKLANRAFEWLSDFEKYGPRYDKVDIASMEAFLETICADRVFDPVFNFHYFGAGICYMIYWMSMLIMQSNTFKLLRTHRQLEPKQLLMWGRQLSGYADSICKSIPFHCRPQTGYTAKFGSLTPLVVARKFYENAPGMQRKAEWCANVYVVARVPGLYQEMPVPLEPFKAVQSTVQQGTKKFI